MQFTLHPRNRDFVWEDRRGPFRRLDEAQVRQFDEQGFVVIEDVFPKALMEALEAVIDPLDARLDQVIAEQMNGKAFIARSGEIMFTTFVVNHSEVAKDFCLGEPFQDIAHDLLGEDVWLYHDQAVYKKPGAKEPFPWHQDNGYTFLEPQRYLTCWVALNDATIENGCPWVVPGLHRKGTLLHRPSELGFVCLDEVGDEPVPAPARAGSIVAFSSLTPHATGPNQTDGVRKAYIVQFSQGGALKYPRDEKGQESPDTVPVAVGDAPHQFRLEIASGS